MTSYPYFNRFYNWFFFCISLILSSSFFFISYSSNFSIHVFFWYFGIWWGWDYDRSFLFILSCSFINIYLLSCYSIYLKLTSLLFSTILVFCSTWLIYKGIASFIFTIYYYLFSWAKSLLLYLSISFLSYLFLRYYYILCYMAFLFYYFNFTSCSSRFFLISYSYCFNCSRFFSYYFFFLSSCSFLSLFSCLTKSLACFTAFYSSNSFSFLLILTS